MEHSEVLQNFIAITQCEEAFALQFLENHGWNLEESVNNYLSGGVGQEHGASGSNGNNPGLVDEDTVRAPIPDKQEVLLGDAHTYSYLPTSNFVGSNAGARHGDVFGQLGRENEAFRDFKAESTASSKKKQSLASLFAPPVELLFRGSFEELQRCASTQKLWILVNIQKPSEFASQMLNRDTWSQDGVKDIVRGSFLFWQQQHDGDHGSRYVRFYKSDQLPCIDIIDPRTRERVQHFSGFIEPQYLVTQLTTFLAANSLESTKAAVKVGNPAKRSKSDNIHEMSEQDQLAAAIKASLESSTTKAKAKATAIDPFEIIDSDDDVAVLDDDESEGETDSNAGTISNPPSEPTSLTTLIEPPPPEPEVGTEGACRVSVRLPDGKKVMRRFLKTDPVDVLIRYLKLNVPEASAPFEIVHSFPANKTVDVTKTLVEEGVSDSMVVMRWTDEE